MADMFLSSNNGNVDPMYYSDLQSYNRPFFSDITTNSKHDQDQFLFSCFHFSNTPFPFCNDQLQLQDHVHDSNLHQSQSHDLLILQQQQQQHPLRATAAASSDTMLDLNTINELTKICNKKSHNSVIPRRKSYKRDRHSKINTAQGPRDRRMRLSLKVAREFFDLQDKLGFDKASKTVEWLLIQARAPIKKLSTTGLPHQFNNNDCSCSVGATKSASSTSECEVVSGIDEAAVVNDIEGSKNSKGSRPSSSSSRVNKTKKAKQPRKTPFHPRPKESREKARARARQRTIEKQWSRRIIDESKLREEAKDQEPKQLTSWSPFETTGEESGTQSHSMNNNNNNNPSMEMLAEIEVEETPISSHDQQQDRLVTTGGMIDDSLMSMAKSWSPCFINHLYNTSLPQENQQIADLHSFCKSWDVAYIS